MSIYLTYHYIVDEHRAVATVSPPFQTYLLDGCRSPSCFKGVYADTFHKLKEKMNFTFTIEWVKVFGGVKNGQWTGMIGIKNIYLIDYFFAHRNISKVLLQCSSPKINSITMYL